MMKTGTKWLIASGAGLAVIGYGLLTAKPADTLGLLCTYDIAYRVQATIQVGDETQTAEVIFRETSSSRWIAQMNSAGCLPTHGTAIAYRLADNRVVLVESRICTEAKRAFADPRSLYSNSPGPDYLVATQKQVEIDLGKFCVGLGGNRNRGGANTTWDGYLIDDADRPTRWEGFRFGQPTTDSKTSIQLVSAKAQAMNVRPTDNLDRVAPGVLQATFQYREDVGEGWSHSPERLISRARRSPQILVRGPERGPAPYPR
jgi:hypothetical protein